MRVGLDMDGVMYSFAEVYFKWLVKAYGTDPLTLRRPSGYYIDVPKDVFYSQCREAVAARFLYVEGEPLPGTQEAMASLVADGHSIHLVTARTIELFGPLTEQNTYEWLDKCSLPYDSVTFTYDKTVVPVDIFLDDKIENVDALLAAGIEGWLMYDPPRIDQLNHPRFIRSWKEFLEKVEELDTRKKAA